MTSSKKRILLVTEADGAACVQAVVDYISKHSLAWNLQTIDHKSWHTGGEHWRLAANGVAAVMGWCRDVRAEGLPMVRWSSRQAQAGEVLLVPDDIAIGRMAARHLHDQGVSTVAVVRPWNLPVRKVRYASFLAEAARLDLLALRYDAPVGLSPHLAEAALAGWLRKVPHPVGVFLHQDRDALAFLRFCQDFALNVPGQVAVVGVDAIPAGAAAIPPLSSVCLPAPIIAKTMAHHLHRLLSGATAGAETLPVAPLHVVTRTSTTIQKVISDPVMETARRLMAEHPGKDHRIDILARKSKLSPDQFHRRFVAACGCTPGQYLRRCRLHLAQQILAESDLTIPAVARRCGLSNASALWKAFRAAGLKSPAHWREERRSGNVRSDLP